MGSPHSFITLLSVLAVLLLLSSANGAITNTTVDDTSSAFTFTGSWTAVSASNPCAGCSSKPDASQTFGGSWHDGNYRTGAPETTGGSFTFTGSAVYIFGIDQAKSQPDIAFTLGSTQSVHHYTGTERFVYNALFFSATGLAADQTHTVNWIFNIDPSTGVGVQAALFDYAIVTSGTEDVAPDPPSTTTTTPALQPKPQTQTTSTSSTHSSSSTTTSSISTTSGQRLAGDQSSSSTPIQSNASSPTSIALSAPSSQSSDTPSGASSSSSGPQSATSEGHHSNVGAIIGAVLGALVVAVLLLILFLLCRRRKQRQRAREDDERRAAGLPPAPPGMRRIRGTAVLQPFVDDRPDPLLAANVFVTSTYATASSARPPAAPSAGAPPGPSGAASVSGAGALDPSGAAAGVSGANAFDAGGSSTGAPDARPGPVLDISAAVNNASSPAFVETAATVGQYPAEKTQDVGYTNPHAQVSRNPSRSTQSDISVLSPTEKLDRDRETAFSSSTVLPPAAVPPPPDTYTSARELYLEQRLATLEAHVASYLPPPYEHPEP